MAGKFFFAKTKCLLNRTMTIKKEVSTSRCLSLSSTSFYLTNTKSSTRQSSLKSYFIFYSTIRKSSSSSSSGFSSTSVNAPRISETKDGQYSSGATLSYWLDSVERPTFKSLDKDETCDFLVVGAGIAGLTSAYCLATTDPTKKVIVVDDGEICSGETGRTTAHLQIEIDDFYYVIEQMYGEKVSKLVCDSNKASVDFIENLSKKIPCDFERLDGYLIPGKEEHKTKVIDKELVAAGKAGMDVELIDSKDKLPHYPLVYPTPHWLKFKNQGMFHPLKYLCGMAQLMSEMPNVTIYTNTHVDDIVDDEKKGTYAGTRNHHRINCKKMVLGTYVPINDRFTMFTKMAEYRSYAMAFEVEKGVIERALYWDTHDIYNYHRLAVDDKSPNGKTELLIVGGKDHLTGDQMHKEDYEKLYAELETMARKMFPCGPVRYRWSGQVTEPMDCLPFLGLNPGDKNIYIITGDSGTGMTNQTIGALVCRDLIYGIDNPWKDIYDPSRQMVKAPLEFLRHNAEIQVAFKDYVTAGEISDIEELARGEGCIMRSGMTKHAVYRDNDGTVYKFSAICPHLKGIVRYNPLEKTFDCPLHGSRFDRYGKCINGPTKHHLTDSHCEVIPPVK